MKKIAAIIIVLLLYAELANAQSPWSLGLTFQPSRYRLYNRTENEAPADLFGVVKPGIFEITGWAAGIIAGHRFTKNIAIETELTWSTQEQKFEWLAYTTDNRKIDTKLNYLKLPLFFKYSIPLNNGGVYLKLGIQFSLLNYYEERFNGMISVGEDFSQVTINGEMSNSLNAEPIENDWLYNRLLFGFASGLGYELFIAKNKISLSFGFLYEYDITNTDNLGARFYSGPLEVFLPAKYYTARSIWKYYRSVGLSSIETPPIQSRKASHNIRFGLELGVKFHFGKKTYRIKKVNANW